MLTPETRSARLADLPILARIEQEAFGDGAYTEMTFRQFHDIAGRLLPVAVVDKAVVGYALALPTVRQDVCFMSLAVCPEWRQRGIGRLLMKEIIETSDELGYSSIWLTTKPTNNTIIRMCAAFAFTRKVNAPVPDYFGPGEDRLVMVRGAQVPALSGTPA